MVSNKRKKIIIDSNMTISELSLLFLENKYNKISYNTYGNYQDRLKIINEYLGNTKLKDFRKNKIEDFEKYLNNERRWNYTFKPSKVTINETKRIQTFPDDYVFCGAKTSVYKQIGNAVPCEMAKSVASAVIEYLNND